MTNLFDAPEHKHRRAWNAVCAKLGQSEAMGVNPGGSLSELHEQRKHMRRAVNAIVTHEGEHGGDDEITSALQHASYAIAKIDNLIDVASRGNGNPSDDSAKVLRTVEDIRAHYAGKFRQSNAPFNIVDFFRGVAGMKTKPEVSNSLTEGTDSAGGYAVPSWVMPKILEALVPASSLLQAGAGIVPLDMGAKSYTYPAINAIPTAAWRNEGANISVSDPTFRAVVAAPKSLAFLFKVSRELLADAAPDMVLGLNTAIAQAFAKELDRAGLRGSGTSPEPRGVLNTSGIQPVANGANGTALASYANFMSAIQAILQADAPMPTAGIMSPRSLVKLGGLLDTTNQPLRPPPMVEKMALIGTSQIPNNLTVGTSNDCSEIYVGDFSTVRLMLREYFSVQRLDERYADTGEIGFVCHARADIALMYPAALAVVTGVRP